MRDEAEHPEQEQEMPEAQQTEQVVKDATAVEKQKPKQAKDQGERADSDDNEDEPMQGVMDLRQSYDEYVQDRAKQEQLED
jgi:hypothetical protein